MKSATGFTGSGARDWVIQRLSAVLLAAYMVVILGWMLCHSGFDFSAWHSFLTTLPMKIFSLLAIAALFAHAWIGMWTVFTDYVTTRQMGANANGLRMVLQAGMVVALFVFTVWGIHIFWG